MLCFYSVYSRGAYLSPKGNLWGDRARYYKLDLRYSLFPFPEQVRELGVNTIISHPASSIRVHFGISKIHFGTQ